MKKLNGLELSAPSTFKHKTTGENNMKRFLLPTLAMLTAVSALAVSPPNSVTQLNQEIKKILSPFQNEKTVANLFFSDIQTNQERALAVKLNGLYKKTGEANKLVVNVDNVSYAYGDGKNPTTNIKGSIGIDLTKIIPQKDLNEMIPSIEDFIKETSKSFTEKYGEAATVDAKVLKKKKNTAGDYTFISLKVSLKLDFAKLPADVKLEDVEIKSAVITAAIDFKKGVTLEAQAISNPDYKGFRSDQKGLKETLDALLSRDAEQLKDIEDLFKSLDEMAGGIVNTAR